jgi:hypothetical protein
MNKNPDTNEVSEWFAWWRERTLGAMLKHKAAKSKYFEKALRETDPAFYDLLNKNIHLRF